jgi:hypothetical protein
MRRILSARVMTVAGLAGLLLVCASLVYIWVLRPGVPAAPEVPLSAALTIIPGPSSTLAPLPATLTPAPPTPFPTPTPRPGQVRVGSYVQIENTGGEGLRIRTEPGLETKVIFSGFDSEVFLVTDGPQQADGYTWWHLTASYDQARSGWAVQDYLTVIEGPTP